jgi:hypothetical protein
MPDISEIIKRAKPRETTVTLYLAGDEAAEIERLEGQLAGLSDTWKPTSLASTNPAEALAKKIKAARERIAKSAVEFQFRALGDKAWSDLIAAHPSKQEGQDYDPETFPRALVSACCVDPVMTAEQADALFEVLNVGQRNELMNGAFDVNAAATSIPFSVSASGILAAITGGS